ncbi:GNAT family N-acetyltransferase [Saccharibacillus alkalitolerans]|uniref:GNAT family N-acetyltransferase n=1 Tax=Saccharibacillus alkalitolerans TaxID=2705290 RepID=UPI0019803FAC|nr:GNAT family N-acetyltransferase [Saccharibacillus alkalitolerans]
MFRFREAQESDIWLLYNWANDPVVRAMSFNKSKISEEEHKSWFKNALACQNPMIYVAEFEENGTAVGTVKLDQNQVIGITLDVEYRGKGLATPLLKRFLQFIENRFGYSFSIYAYIKDENFASISTFEKSGFQLQGNFEEKGFKFKKYEYKCGNDGNE